MDYGTAVEIIVMIIKQFGKLNNSKCEEKHITKLYLYSDNNYAKTACMWAGSRRSVKQVNTGSPGGGVWVIRCRTDGE